MPVDAVRRLQFTCSGGHCVVRPDYRRWLEEHGLITARDFLALQGVVVSGHVGRNVSRVLIGTTTAYLKREHRVRWRDRFRSWQQGFGWASVSAREASVLRRLDEHDLPGPIWLAHGEVDGEAFLLIEAAATAADLRTRSPISHELAERLGCVIAQIHAAGIDQPDLFAKHILVNPVGSQITILDWQRATLLCEVPRRRRIRSLAALRATSGQGAWTSPSWVRLLSGYAAVSGDDLGSLTASVDAAAERLARRGTICSQCTITAPQELVRIGGETVCAIPSMARELEPPDVIASLYDPANDGRTIHFRDGRTGTLRVRRYRTPIGRWWSAVRGKVWRSTELKAARLLFHLERHGIAAPKLLAYGQVTARFRPAGSFLLAEVPEARPPDTGDRNEIEALLGRLHAAGCSIRQLGPIGEPFGIDAIGAVIIDASRLRQARRLSRRRVESELACLGAFFRGRR